METSKNPRYIGKAIQELAFDHGKMAFVAGPRQVGKTTLAKDLLSKRGAGKYFNWDQIEFRRLWAKSPSSLFSSDAKPLENTTIHSQTMPLYLFDEIHKAKGWKSTIKGLYDNFGESASILVTGSARLNVFRKGSDSLMGRYLYFRLHPLSVGELVSSRLLEPEKALQAILAGPKETSEAQEALLGLERFGGFPEPFFSQSDKRTHLWRRGRLEKIIREDLRDLSRIPELSKVEMLAALLPERAGSGLSIPSLREDLEVSYDTVKRWLEYLSELFYFYEIKPFSGSIPRAVKKEGKLYLWDWPEGPSEGARFENLIASHLNKACHFWTDTGEGDFELHTLRNKEKHEIDFILTKNRKPWFAVEVKVSDKSWSPHFKAFSKRLGGIPQVQIVKTPGVFKKRKEDSGVIISAARLLSVLP